MRVQEVLRRVRNRLGWWLYFEQMFARRRRTLRVGQRRQDSIIPAQVLEPRVLLSGTDPDDQVSEAVAVTVGQTVSGEIESGDVDMYSVTVSAGQTIAFDIDQSSGTIDFYLRLFDSSGQQLAVRDNQAAPGELLGTEPYLRYFFSTAGTYYLGISGVANSSYNPIDGTGDNTTNVGTYELTIEEVADFDDQISEATAISFASVVEGTIYSGDVDMYSINVQSSQLLSFDLDVLNDNQYYGYLRLFDSAGNQLASNWQTPAPGNTGVWDAYLEYSFASAGTYYVGISNGGNKNYNPLTGEGDLQGGEGAYELVIDSISSEDTDDQISEAVVVGLAQTVSDRINSADVDMFALTVNANQTIRFDVDLLSGSADLFLRLFDSNGQQLTTQYNRAAPGETSATDPYLQWTFSASGAYYIGISAYTNRTYDPVAGTGDLNSGYGDYQLTIEEFIDSNDQLNEAIAVSIPSVNQGTVDSGDVTMYSFEVQGNQLLSFDLDVIEVSAYSGYLRLFDSAGNQLAANWQAASPGDSGQWDAYLEYFFADAGTYYIGVSNAGNKIYNPVTGSGDSHGGYGSYELTILDITVSNLSPTNISLSSDFIDENRPIGTVVGTLAATDPNTEINLTYSLVSGAGSTDNAQFTISGDQLLSAASFDYATKSSYSVRIRVTDELGLWYEKAFTININGEPTAVADTATTPFNTSVVINVLANDTDTANGLLRLVSVTSPANGVAQLRPNVPELLWNNWQAFGQASHATFDDWYAHTYTYELNGETVYLGPLNGAPITYQIEYTPGSTFSGVDTFSYIVEDEHGAQSTGNVTVTTAESTLPTVNAQLIQLLGDNGNGASYTPTLIGQLLGFPTGAEVIVEFDHDEDGIVDGSLTVSIDNQNETEYFVYNIADLTLGEHTISVRTKYQLPSEASPRISSWLDFEMTLLEGTSSQFQSLYSSTKTYGETGAPDTLTLNVIRGRLSGGSQGRAFQTVEFDHNGDGTADGFAISDAEGAFEYLPLGAPAGQRTIHARTVLENEQGDVIGSGSWSSLSFWVSALPVGGFASIGLKEEIGEQSPDWTTSLPIISGEVSIGRPSGVHFGDPEGRDGNYGYGYSYPDVSGNEEDVIVEFDLDRDGTVDGRILTDDDGKFSFLAADSDLGLNTIALRTVRWDDRFQVQLTSGWSTFSYTFENSPTTSPTLTLGLEVNGTAVTGNSVDTSPIVTGTISGLIDDRAVTIEFSHAASGSTIDGTATPTADGKFRYLPIGLTTGSQTIRARTKSWDASTQTYAFGNWQTLTFQITPAGTGPVITLPPTSGTGQPTTPSLPHDDGNDSFASEFNDAVWLADWERQNGLQQAQSAYDSAIASAKTNLDNLLAQFETDLQSALSQFSGDTSTLSFDKFSWADLPVMISFPPLPKPELPQSPLGEDEKDPTSILNRLLKGVNLDRNTQYNQQVGAAQAAYGAGYQQLQQTLSNQLKSIEQAYTKAAQSASLEVQRARQQADTILAKAQAAFNESSLQAKYDAIEQAYQASIEPLYAQIQVLEQSQYVYDGLSYPQASSDYQIAIQEIADELYEDWVNQQYYGYYNPYYGSSYGSYYGSGNQELHEFLVALANADSDFETAKQTISRDSIIGQANHQYQIQSQIATINNTIAGLRQQADLDRSKARIEFQEQKEKALASADETAAKLLANATKSQATAIATAQSTRVMAELNLSQTFQSEAMSLEASLQQAMSSAVEAAYNAFIQATPGPQSSFLQAIIGLEKSYASTMTGLSTSLTQSQTSAYVSAMSSVIAADAAEASAQAESAYAMSTASITAKKTHQDATIDARVTQLTEAVESRKEYNSEFSQASLTYDIAMLEAERTKAVSDANNSFEWYKNQYDYYRELHPDGVYNFLDPTPDPNSTYPYIHLDFQGANSNITDQAWWDRVYQNNANFYSQAGTINETRRLDEIDAKETKASSRLETASTYQTDRAEQDSAYSKEVASADQTYQSTMLAAQKSQADAQTDATKAAMTAGVEAAIAYRKALNQSSADYDIGTNEAGLNRQVGSLGAAQDFQTQLAADELSRVNQWATPPVGQTLSAYQQYQKDVAQAKYDRLAITTNAFPSAYPDYRDRFASPSGGSASPEMNRMIEAAAASQAAKEQATQANREAVDEELDELKDLALQNLGTSETQAKATTSAQFAEAEAILGAKKDLADAQAEAASTSSQTNAQAMLDMVSSLNEAYWNYQRTPYQTGASAAMDQAYIQAKTQYLTTVASAQQALVASNVSSSQAFQSAVQTARTDYAGSQRGIDDSAFSSTSQLKKSSALDSTNRAAALQRSQLTNNQTHQSNAKDLGQNYEAASKQADVAYQNAIKEAANDYQLAAAQENYDRVVAWKNALTPGTVVEGVVITTEIAQFYLDLAAADLAWVTASVNARPTYDTALQDAQSAYDSAINSAEDAAFSSQQSLQSTYSNAVIDNDEDRQEVIINAGDAYSTSIHNTTQQRRQDEYEANAQFITDAGQLTRDHLTTTFADYATHVTNSANAHFSVAGNQTNSDYYDQQAWNAAVGPLRNSRLSVLAGFSQTHTGALGQAQIDYVTEMGDFALTNASDVNTAQSDLTTAITDLPELARSVTTSYVTGMNDVDTQYTSALSAAQQARAQSQNQAWKTYSSALNQADADRKIAYAEAFIDYQRSLSLRLKNEAEALAQTSGLAADQVAATEAAAKYTWVDEAAVGYLAKQTADATAWKTYSDAVDTALNVRLSANEQANATFEATRTSLLNAYDLDSANSGLDYDEDVNSAYESFLNTRNGIDATRRTGDAQASVYGAIARSNNAKTFYDSQYPSTFQFTDYGAMIGEGNWDEESLDYQNYLTDSANQTTLNNNSNTWKTGAVNADNTYDRARNQADYDNAVAIADAEYEYEIAIAPAESARATANLNSELAYREAVQDASELLLKALAESDADYQTSILTADVTAWEELSDELETPWASFKADQANVILAAWTSAKTEFVAIQGGMAEAQSQQEAAIRDAYETYKQTEISLREAFNVAVAGIDKTLALQLAANWKSLNDFKADERKNYFTTYSAYPSQESRDWNYSVNMRAEDFSHANQRYTSQMNRNNAFYDLKGELDEDLAQANQVRRLAELTAQQVTSNTTIQLDLESNSLIADAIAESSADLLTVDTNGDSVPDAGETPWHTHFACVTDAESTFLAIQRTLLQTRLQAEASSEFDFLEEIAAAELEVTLGRLDQANQTERQQSANEIGSAHSQVVQKIDHTNYEAPIMDTFKNGVTIGQVDGENLMTGGLRKMQQNIKGHNYGGMNAGIPQYGGAPNDGSTWDNGYGTIGGTTFGGFGGATGSGSGFTPGLGDMSSLANSVNSKSDELNQLLNSDRIYSVDYSFGFPLDSNLKLAAEIPEDLPEVSGGVVDLGVFPQEPEQPQEETGGDTSENDEVIIIIVLDGSSVTSNGPSEETVNEYKSLGNEVLQKAAQLKVTSDGASRSSLLNEINEKLTRVRALEDVMGIEHFVDQQLTEMSYLTPPPTQPKPKPADTIAGQLYEWFWGDSKYRNEGFGDAILDERSMNASNPESRLVDEGFRRNNATATAGIQAGAGFDNGVANLKAFNDFVLQLNPVTGTPISALNIVSGQDVMTGEDLTWKGYALEGIGFIPAAGLSKGAGKLFGAFASLADEGIGAAQAVFKNEFGKSASNVADLMRRVSGRGSLGAAPLTRQELMKFSEDVKFLGGHLEKNADKFLDSISSIEPARAGFMGSTKTIYLRKGATLYDAIHEIGHLTHLNEIGPDAYKKLGTFEKELYVFEFLMDRRSLFNEEQIYHAVSYMLDTARRNGRL